MIPKKQMMIPPTGVPVVVWWEDAWSVAGGDAPKEEFIARSQDASLRVDCGWLVEKNDRFILLSLTLDPAPPGAETCHGGPSRIPRCLVRKIIKLCPSCPSRRSRSKRPSSSPKKSPLPSVPPPSPSPPSSTSPESGAGRLTVEDLLSYPPFISCGRGISTEPIQPENYPDPFPDLPEDDLDGNIDPPDFLA